MSRLAITPKPSSTSPDHDPPHRTPATGTFHPRRRFAPSDLRSRPRVSFHQTTGMTSQSYLDETAPAMLSAIPCRDCVTECTQQPCPGPAVELTAQCTDQCIVIACHDPTHDESPCPGTGAEHQCDLLCDGIAECMDCTGYQDLVRCVRSYVLRDLTISSFVPSFSAAQTIIHIHPNRGLTRIP